MFLSSLESILMVKKHSIDYTQIIFIIIIVCSLFFTSIESVHLVNQIIPHVIQLSNDIVDDNPLVIENDDNDDKLNDKNMSSIIVKEELFEEIRDDLILNDYPHVQYIHFQDRSFENISNLTISILSKLKHLIFEDESFKKTASLTQSSI